MRDDDVDFRHVYRPSGKCRWPTFTACSLAAVIFAAGLGAFSYATGGPGATFGLVSLVLFTGYATGAAVYFGRCRSPRFAALIAVLAAVSVLGGQELAGFVAAEGAAEIGAVDKWVKFVDHQLGVTQAERFFGAAKLVLTPLLAIAFALWIAMPTAHRPYCEHSDWWMPLQERTISKAVSQKLIEWLQHGSLNEAKVGSLGNIDTSGSTGERAEIRLYLPTRIENGPDDFPRFLGIVKRHEGLLKQTLLGMHIALIRSQLCPLLPPTRLSVTEAEILLRLLPPAAEVTTIESVPGPGTAIATKRPIPEPYCGKVLTRRLFVLLYTIFAALIVFNIIAFAEGVRLISQGNVVLGIASMVFGIAVLVLSFPLNWDNRLVCWLLRRAFQSRPANMIDWAHPDLTYIDVVGHRPGLDNPLDIGFLQIDADQLICEGDSFCYHMPLDAVQRCELCATKYGIGFVRLIALTDEGKREWAIRPCIRANYRLLGGNSLERSKRLFLQMKAMLAG